jgi:hemerythrin-like domain-containing protein
LDAIGIIRAEHRSLGAVHHGMLYLIREIRFAGARPDFDVFKAMVHYIDAFPELYHHPKEDAYLFRLLRLRRPPTAPLIDRLQSEHELGAARIRTLAQALRRYEELGTAGFSLFAEAAGASAALHYAHMRTEEDEMLPLAIAHLTPGDWKQIDAAFAGHTDPLFGADASAHYANLFRQIVRLAPPPIGVGRAR